MWHVRTNPQCQKCVRTCAPFDNQNHTSPYKTEQKIYQQADNRQVFWSLQPVILAKCTNQTTQIRRKWTQHFMLRWHKVKINKWVYFLFIYPLVTRWYCFTMFIGYTAPNEERSWSQLRNKKGLGRTWSSWRYELETKPRETRQTTKTFDYNWGTLAQDMWAHRAG